MKLIRLPLIFFLIWSGCEASPFLVGPSRFVGPPSPKRPRVDTDTAESPTDFYRKFRDWNVHKDGKIPEDIVAPFLGHGGTYESVSSVASKLNTIESDHAPHFSILEYVDPDKAGDDLPKRIKTVLAERKRLEIQLGRTDYPKNEEEMKRLKGKIDKLNKLKKPIRVNNWKNSVLQIEYNGNVVEMKVLSHKIKMLEKDLKSKPGDAVINTEIADHKKKISELLNRNKKLRTEAEAALGIPDAKEALEKAKVEQKNLEKVNKNLRQELDNHNENIKKAMAVLSIPYDKHRIFPSTGHGGLDKDIRSLKDADSANAKAAMDVYDDNWKKDMNKAISLKYIEGEDMFKLGGDAYDYQALWEHNFDRVITAVESERRESKEGKRKSSLTPETQQEYLSRMHRNYAKKFMTTAIYYVKTPEAGYTRLMNLYINEYKLYLKNSYDSYKPGITKLLEANAQFGWISDIEVEETKTRHDLDKPASDPSEEWRTIEELVTTESKRKYNPIIHGDLDLASTSSIHCSASTRRKRGATENCVFFTKRKDTDTEVGEKKVGPNSDDDGLPSPKIRLPTDNEDTVAIDSKRLIRLLNDLNGDDIESVRTKEAVVELASKDADKLTGTPEEIAEAKARLKQENLDHHSDKATLANALLRENDGGHIPPKAVTKYKKTKIPASKLAKRLGRFTKATNRFSSQYGKIMLAKGFITALRHGDYESLALMGGRVGLDWALDGVTKLGQHIAKKATTKFMTKLGSKYLGKLAGPVGAVADIGINIYSITKSVKLLNNPKASKFDQNDAIADIVADSIDIASTATAEALSLAFPRLAPVFRAVAFITNLLTTFVVAFYKAANNVDRINEELPLLDFEKFREYFRYIGGSDTSAYIQELIDTKRANNIIANATVQFLNKNTDYIGKVFPSRVLHPPGVVCRLQEKQCPVYLETRGPCTNWANVSKCAGNGLYCEDDYNNRKCQSGSYTVKITRSGSNRVEFEYRCECGMEPEPQWGHEILDSEVNFLHKQRVYMQRAAPDFAVPTGFTYICKPSSLSNEGEQISWPTPETAYHCKGAIGVKRSNSQGKFMLYDLGNGTDSILLDTREAINNLFVVNDGFKRYEGNSGDDTFLLDGPCKNLTGSLNGGFYKSLGNTLVLGPNCKSGGTLEVDLRSETMWLEGNRVELTSIQRVIGRQKKTDIVRVDCSTKSIALQGGISRLDPDQIHLPGQCSNQTEITMALEGSGTVYATSFSGGKVFVLLQKTGLSFNAKVPSAMQSGTLLFKFEESVGKLSNASLDWTRGQIQLEFEDGGSASFEITQILNLARPASCNGSSHENPIQILITENGNFSRHLSFDLKYPGQLQAIHVMEIESASTTINGYDFTDNVFHLKSGEWHVSGGRGRMNQFILKSSEFSGSIDGTSPSQSTLHISNDVIVNPIRIDFKFGQIVGTKISVQNIDRLVGRSDYIEDVAVSCTAIFLELGGNARDIVNIPGINGCSPEVRISAKGKLLVEDRKLSGATTIEAGYYDPCVGQSGEKLDLHVNNLGGGDTTLVLNYPSSILTAATPNVINVSGDGGGTVLINGSFPNIYFEEDNNIKSALVLDEISGNVVAYHELKVEKSFETIPKSRNGPKVIQNVFKLENGKNWRVDGGNKGDVFYFLDSTFSGSLDGRGGRNQLFVGDGIQGEVEVKQSELFLDREKSLEFSYIQEIYGRAGQSEVVEVGCDTQYLALNGGNTEKSDQITIPNSLSKCSSNFSRSLTISAVGFTQVNSNRSALGKVDTYVSRDTTNELRFKGNLQVSPNTIFNFPIQVLSYKLSSYQLNIQKVDAGAGDNVTSVESIQLKLNLMDNENFLDFTLNYQNGAYLPLNVNWMFVDKDFNSNGNIFINIDLREIIVLHTLKMNESGDTQEQVTRRGAVGAKNVFRLHSGLWDAFGGAMDDSFLLNENEFQGQIHGLQGVNTLVLSETLTAPSIDISLVKNSMKLMDKDGESQTEVTVKSIQVVGGRKGKKEMIVCGCDTLLIKSEGGGAGKDEQDEIYIQDRPCSSEMEMDIVLTDFSKVENLARKGDFTYHVQALQSSSWDIKYIATDETRHQIKFEMSLEEVKEMNIILEEQEEGNSQSIQIIFNDTGSKRFPLNIDRLPSFQISTGKELVADIWFPEVENEFTELYAIIRSSIIATTPFSEMIHGLNGVENEILVKTSSNLKGIFGGDTDDNICLHEVNSILVINAGGGLNQLQLFDELHRGLDMEVDFQLEKISFVEDHTDFVTVVQGIQKFVGREHSFERVVLGCTTKSVKWAEEVSIKNWNCGYDVKIELGNSTRVIFEEVDLNEQEMLVDSEDEDEEENTDESSEENYDDDDDDVSEPHYLDESTFHYHFTSIRSFDIQVETFKSLRDTRHIFYLNFTLTDLTSIRFSLNESRLIYSIHQDPSLEYSHLVGELENTAMFYSHPEFMTAEGFHLRITRYGEVMVVMGGIAETLELNIIHRDAIPWLSSQAERLGISFMVETEKDFFYTGCPLQEEVDLLTNRLNSTSHLIGWNRTTYEILDMQNDTWIYPQKVQEDSDSIHVIDLTTIVFQIRNQTDQKYVPEVRQVDGTHLEIVMTNWTHIFPGSVFIANGTEYGKSIVILLKSIAMEIVPDVPYNQSRMWLEETNWKIKPRPILIPRGHTYAFSTEDLEDGVDIKRAGGDDQHDTLTYGRDNWDLVITGINTDNITGMESYTSLIILNYFDVPGQQHLLNSMKGDEVDGTESFNVTSAEKVNYIAYLEPTVGSVEHIANVTSAQKVESIARYHIELGRETVNVSSNEPILIEETGEEVQLAPYEDILEQMEYKIVKDFSDIPRHFVVSCAQKIKRTQIDPSFYSKFSPSFRLGNNVSQDSNNSNMC